MPRTLVATSLAAALVLLLAGTEARAAILTFEAYLDSLQEVPPLQSPGTGYLEATVNDANGMFTVVTGNYQDLYGGSTAVTINQAPAGSNGPVLFNLTLDAANSTSGTYSGSGTLTAPQIAALNAGNLYINIRSTVYTGGEIRGQLMATPEPGTLALFALGAAGILAVARRPR